MCIINVDNNMYINRNVYMCTIDYRYMSIINVDNHMYINRSAYMCTISVVH